MISVFSGKGICLVMAKVKIRETNVQLNVQYQPTEIILK